VKEVAKRIFRKTLAAIDIRAALARRLARDGALIHFGENPLIEEIIDLRKFRKIVAIAFGKAAFAMADGLASLLQPGYPVEGILVVPALPAHDLPGWTTFIGGHPVPNAVSFEAGRAILDRLGRCGPETLIFFLISGGGSALVEQPLHPDVTLKDFEQLNAVLVTCGAPIEEINVIRKHLSAMKGGRLAAAALNSTKLTFAISDVPQGYETALASGPTLPDPTTIEDCERVVQEYGLLAKFPESIRSVFEQRRLSETPKDGDPAFEKARFELLLGEHDLTHAAHHACEAEGLLCVCDTSADHWPFQKAADHLLALLESQKRANPGRGVAIIADGEVISPVTGDGIGGRNSAFVLACVPKIAGKKITVLSAGTDGIDGNSPAAGAVANGETLARSNATGMDPADFSARCDACSLFQRLGDAIVTGPTGNNLRDLRILIAE
jgi:glycerate 2-kinase